MKNNSITKKLKQIWNSAIAGVVAMAILEQQHRKFCARYSEYCDLQFPNLEGTRPIFPFILIFNYKRSTHHKEKGEPSPKEKNHKETKEK